MLGYAYGRKPTARPKTMSKAGNVDDPGFEAMDESRVCIVSEKME